MSFVDALLNALAQRKNDDYLDLWDVIQTCGIRITQAYEARHYLIANQTFSSQTIPLNLLKLFYDQAESNVQLMFENCTFENVQMNEGSFAGVTFKECFFENFKIEETKFYQCRFQNKLYNTHFTSCAFTDSFFDTTEYCQFIQTNFTNCYFNTIQGSELQGEIQNSTINRIENVTAENSIFNKIRIEFMKDSNFSNTLFNEFTFGSIYRTDLSKTTIVKMQPLPEAGSYDIVDSNFSNSTLINCTMTEIDDFARIVHIRNSQFHQAHFVQFQSHAYNAYSEDFLTISNCNMTNIRMESDPSKHSLVISNLFNTVISGYFYGSHIKIQNNFIGNRISPQLNASKMILNYKELSSDKNSIGPGTLSNHSAISNVENTTFFEISILSNSLLSEISNCELSGIVATDAEEISIMDSNVTQIHLISSNLFIVNSKIQKIVFNNSGSIQAVNEIISSEISNLIVNSSYLFLDFCNINQSVLSNRITLKLAHCLFSKVDTSNLEYLELPYLTETDMKAFYFNDNTSVSIKEFISYQNLSGIHFGKNISLSGYLNAVDFSKANLSQLQVIADKSGCAVTFRTEVNFTETHLENATIQCACLWGSNTPLNLTFFKDAGAYTSPNTQVECDSIRNNNTGEMLTIFGLIIGNVLLCLLGVFCLEKYRNNRSYKKIPNELNLAPTPDFASLSATVTLP